MVPIREFIKLLSQLEDLYLDCPRLMAAEDLDDSGQLEKSHKSVEGLYYENVKEILFKKHNRKLPHQGRVVGNERRSFDYLIQGVRERPLYQTMIS